GPLSMDAQAESGSGNGGAGAALAAPARTGGDIINNAAAIRLGKALFWDENSGGDGRIACATCHFHAGADNRTLNTGNPGPGNAFQIVIGPGAELGGFGTFDGNVVNDRVGSQGIDSRSFNGINLGNPVDNCTAINDPVFGHNRRVTGRNTPSAIGAVFNRQN